MAILTTDKVRNSNSVQKLGGYRTPCFQASNIGLGCVHIDTSASPGTRIQVPRNASLHVFQWRPFTLIRVVYEYASRNKLRVPWHNQSFWQVKVKPPVLPVLGSLLLQNWCMQPRSWFCWTNSTGNINVCRDLPLPSLKPITAFACRTLFSTVPWPMTARWNNTCARLS